MRFEFVDKPDVLLKQGLSRVETTQFIAGCKMITTYCVKK